jgi:hypothetical protein
LRIRSSAAYTIDTLESSFRKGQVVITAKDLTQEDRDRLNGGVERIIQKSDRDEMLRQLSRELAKCVKRQTVRGA